jgi:acylglycerol lipase
VSVRAAGELIGTGGTRLFTQSWQPSAEAPPRAVVILVHGLGEHSDRYSHVAERLVAEGYAVWAEDHRGHGRSDGPRERFAVADVVTDLDRLVDRAVAAHPGSPVFVLGHSLGGLLTIRYALAHGERLAGLVLSGPLAALDGPPAAVRVGRILARLAPQLPLVGLDAGLVSRDPAVVAAYRADPLVHHGRIPAATAAGLAEAVAGLPSAVGAITLPTLIVLGTADRLCPPRGAQMLAERLGGDDVTLRGYEGLAHEVLNEPERETVLDDVVAWLSARAPAGVASASGS